MSGLLSVQWPGLGLVVGRKQTNCIYFDEIPRYRPGPPPHSQLHSHLTDNSFYRNQFWSCFQRARRPLFFCIEMIPS